jgi:hypothetical protein
MRLDYPLKPVHAIRLLLVLLCIEVVFVVLNLVDFQIGYSSVKFHRLISLDLEANIPTWFSSVQLLCIGVIPLSLALSRDFKAPPSKNGLILFGLGFVYLSLDEAASLHEKMTYTFHNNPLVPYFDGVHGIWITVYMVVMIVMLILLWKDLIAIAKRFPKESWLFTCGMILYLAGSAGAETVTFFYIDKSNPVIYFLEVLCEESLEMVGASVLLTSVLLAAIKKSEQAS